MAISKAAAAPAEPEEAPVDAMMDAPDARPYADAVTDAHREFLAEQGVIV
jgi:hypothetical protein